MQKAKRQTSRRQAILVPGMHRSGTSALSGMLVKLGVQAPKSLMEPTSDNPKGYWESTALMRFHDEVLTSAGTVWSDWDKFNPSWMESAVAGDFLARLPEVLEQEYGNAKLLLVKDPRICRLLPLWLHVLPDLDITPKIVLPVRHPLEVARSLEARNDFGRQRSYLAWLRHMLDAEFHSRGHNRVVVGYADMLMDWRRQADRISGELAIKWPKWSSAVEADIDEYLNVELRHQVAGEEISADGSDIASWVAQTYQAMMKMTMSDAAFDDAQRTLDQVRVNFDQSSGVYAAVVRECENKASATVMKLNGRMGEADKRYADLLKEVAGLADDIGKTAGADSARLSSSNTGELVSLVEQLDAERMARAQAASIDTERISDLSAQLATSRDDLSQATAAHQDELRRVTASNAAQIERLQAALVQCLEKHESQIAVLGEQHASEINRLRESGKQSEQSLNERFADLSSQVAASQERLSQATAAHQDELRQVTASNAAQIEQISHLASARETMLADQKQQIERLQAALAQCLEKHESQIAVLGEQHASEINRLRESGKQSEQSLNERFAEIAKLTTMVFDLERRLESERALRASDKHDSGVKLSELERMLEKERTLRADDKHEGQALFSGLERELDLHRDLAADRLGQLQRIQGGKSWKAITLLRRLVRPGQGVPAPDAPDASEEDVIRESGLFDNEWYLRRYPDVRERGLDPLDHYLRYGAQEGRDPSPVFNTRDYVSRYPDVAAAGINPLLHYFRFGISEGRRTRDRDKGRTD